MKSRNSREGRYAGHLGDRAFRWHGIIGTVGSMMALVALRSRFDTFDLDRYAFLYKRTIVPCGVLTWSSTLNCDRCRRVDFTRIAPDVEVSTVFLGMNHNFFQGAPDMWFETMVFKKGKGDITRRTATYDEARAVHQSVVDGLREKYTNGTQPNECAGA